MIRSRGNKFVKEIKPMDTPTTAQLQSALKRINTRLTDLEEFGATQSKAYSYYTNLALKLGGSGIKYGKTGKPSLDIPRISELSDTQKMLLMKGGAKGKKGKPTRHTLGEEKRKAQEIARERGKKEPTEDELLEIMAEQDEIHRFIEDNANQIYKVNSLTKAVRAPRKLTDNEAKRLLNMYQNPRYREGGRFVGDKKKKSDVPKEGRNGNNKKR